MLKPTPGNRILLQYTTVGHLHNLHCSSGNISVMKSEEYEISETRGTHGQADKSRKS
jgi:hypothetical protein